MRHSEFVENQGRDPHLRVCGGKDDCDKERRAEQLVEGQDHSADVGVVGEGGKDAHRLACVTALLPSLIQLYFFFNIVLLKDLQRMIMIAK